MALVWLPWAGCSGDGNSSTLNASGDLSVVVTNLGDIERSCLAHR
jgi:hypothetical protein